MTMRIDILRLPASADAAEVVAAIEAVGLRGC